MQDEMTITVIAAGFDDPNAPEIEEEEEPVIPAVHEEEEEPVIPIDNPLINGLGGREQSSANNMRQPQSSQDYDLDDILKILGN